MKNLPVKNLLSNRFHIEFSEYCVDKFLPDHFIILKIHHNPRSRQGYIAKDIQSVLQEDIGIPIRATAYISTDEDGCRSRSAFIMIDNTAEIRSIRERIEKNHGNLIVSEIKNVAEAVIMKGLPKTSLLQLLVGWMCNDLDNDEEGDVFNNTMGTTLVWPNHRSFKGEWFDNTQHFSRGIKTWNSRIFNRSKTHTAVNIGISGDGVIYPCVAPFVEAFPNNAMQAELYHPYEVDDYGRIVPVWNYSPKKRYWYRQGQKGSPAQMKFLYHDTFKKFRLSRMGFLAEFLRQVQQKLGSGRTDEWLVRLQQFDYSSAQDLIEITPEIKDDAIFNTCLQIVKEKLTISCLEDVDISDELQNGINILRDFLSELGIKYVDENYNTKKLNIIIHYDQDHYNEKDDLRREFSAKHHGEIMQGITVKNLAFQNRPLPTGDEEDDEANIKKYEQARGRFQRSVDSIARICIISLAIKQCLQRSNAKVLLKTLSKTFSGKFPNAISAAIRKPNETLVKGIPKKNAIYYVVTADFQKPSVKCWHFMEDQKNDSLENATIVMGFNHAGDNYNTNNPDLNIEMLIWQDINDIYQIYRTDEHVIPNIEIMRQNLSDTNKEKPKQWLIDLLDEFVNTAEEGSIQEYENYRNQVLEKLDKYPDGLVSYANFQNCLCSNSKGFKQAYEGFKGFLSMKGITLNAGIRNKSNEEEFGYGMVNLNRIMAFPTQGADGLVKEHSYSYYVGVKGNLKPNVMAKGIVIRNIVRKNLQKIDEVFVKNILSMTSVDFVRLGQYTVKPFLLRLLNEYASIYGDTIEDSDRDININALNQLSFKFPVEEI